MTKLPKKLIDNRQAFRISLKAYNAYHAALRPLIYSSRYVHLRVAAQAADLVSGASRNRALFISRDKDLEYIRASLYAATCGEDMLLDSFITRSDFLLVVFHNWLCEVAPFIKRYIVTVSIFLTDGTEQSFRAAERMRHEIGANHLFYGASQEMIERMQLANDLSEKVLRQYRHLARKLSRSLGRGLSRADARQVGMIGLLRAWLSYNPCRNIGFGVYAARSWVPQAIMEEKKVFGETPITLPARIWNQYAQISNCESCLEAEHGPHLSGELKADLINKKLGFDQTTVQDTKSLVEAAFTKSLSDILRGARQKDGDELTLLDRLAAPEAEEQVSAELTQAITGLPHRQRRVICFAFGMWDFLPRRKIKRSAIKLERRRQTAP